MDKIADVDFLSKLDTIFTGYITKQKELLNEFGVTNNRIVQLIEDAESGFVIVKMLIPYLLSFFTVFIASINYLLIGIILRGIGFKLIERPIFSKFKLPDNIILGSGIMILTGLIASWLKLEYSQALVLNIIFIVETIFIVQGFAVFDFFLKKRNIRLAFRVLLSIMLLPLAGIMIIIGFLDSAFDIRKLRRLKS